MFGYDEIPVENEEELRRRQAMDALRNMMAGGAPAPVVMSDPGDALSAAIANGKAAMQQAASPFTSAASQIGARLGGGLGGMWGDTGQSFEQPEVDPSMGLDLSKFAGSESMPGGFGPSTYQHYSATANPTAPNVLAQRMLPNSQDGPMGPLEPMGPPAPTPAPSVFGIPLTGQTGQSNWRQSGGALINDGSGMASPMANGPGAGYTRQGMDGSITPIAFSTDADWGNRLAMEPYTNPLIQDMIRRDDSRSRLQAQQIAGDMARVQVMTGGKAESQHERNQQAAIKTAYNPMLSQAGKDAAISKLDLPEDQKNTMRMETATTIFDPKTKQNVPLGHTDKSGQVDISGLLSKLPTDIPKEQALKFLEEKRGVDPVELQKIVSRLVQYKENATQKMWESPKYEKDRREYDLLVRWGFMKPVEIYPDEYMGSGGGYAQ